MLYKAEHHALSREAAKDGRADVAYFVLSLFHSGQAPWLCRAEPTCFANEAKPSSSFAMATFHFANDAWHHSQI